MHFRELRSQTRMVRSLDALDLFKTSELQSIIDKLIFYWHPVQFIFGTKKQFFQQHYSNSPEFMELKL
jgi:hypothetical protein